MLRLTLACCMCQLLVLLGVGWAAEPATDDEATTDNAVAATVDADTPVPGLPKTMEEFEARVAEQALDVKKAAKLWFDAVFVYLTVDKELGAKMITVMTKDKEWAKKSYFMAALKEKPYIFGSYAKGTSPANNYEMDPNKYELAIQKLERKPYADKEQDAYIKMFIKSSGADSSRPMVFQRNIRGEYKVFEFSSIYVGIRPPQTVSDAKDDF